MPLWDDLTERIDSAKETKRCRFGKIINALDLPERAALDKAIEMGAAEQDLPQHLRIFTTQWFTSTFNNNGYAIGKTAVGDHLKGACSCDSCK